ncbi:MAG: polysaccharide deacetylase family protein [Deltaproteobacteria bacterium]|nr:polysaccharide deacetylase family protein [Deltaproteobacteria bacterium]
MDLNRAVRLPVSVLGIGLFALTLFFAVEWGERPARGRDAGGTRQRSRRSTDAGMATGRSAPASETLKGRPGSAGRRLQDAALLLGLDRPRVKRIATRWRRFDGTRIVWDQRVGRLVTFTFDDGPSHRVTPYLLDQLDRFGIKATFFVVGRRFGGRSSIAQKNQEVLREEVRRGHFVGSHSYTHPMMAQLSTDRQKWEIMSNEEAIVRTCGLRPYLYRPPFGGRTAYSNRLLERRAYAIAMWNLSSGDPFGRHVAKVHRTVLKKIHKHRGGIVLMHDTNGWSAAAVPLIVRSILLESCTLMRRGEQPYLIVGLDRFAADAHGRLVPLDAEDKTEAAAWFDRTRRLCQAGIREP